MSCLPGDLTMNVWIIPSVIDKCPFQDHLSSKTIVFTQSSVSQDLNDEHSELSLSQCH